MGSGYSGVSIGFGIAPLEELVCWAKYNDW